MRKSNCYPTVGFLNLAILSLSCWIATGEDKQCNHYLGNHCYEIVNSEMQYSEADNYCKTNNGILVTIKDNETQAYLLPLLNGMSNYWIGLRIISGLGVFSDGSPLNQDSFAPWSSSYEDKQQKHCVLLQSQTKRWFLHPCENYYEKYRFICQYPGKSCKFEDCKIANGVAQECITSESFQPQDVLNWECNANGYFLEGPTNITCQANGEWTELPVCKEGCNPPEIPKSTTALTLKDGYEMEEIVSIFCKEGFFALGEELSPSIPIVCQPNGTWLPLIPECLSFKGYENPTLTPKGIEIFARREEDIALNCPNSKHRLPSYISWYQNGNKLATVNFSTDTILGLSPSDETGRLMLKNFSEADEGYYSCVLKNKDLQQISAITYNVRMQISDKCNGDAEETDIVVEKYTDGLLECGNHSPSEVRWYKDGNRIWGNSRQQILPDGILMLKRVKPKDKGTYICSVTDLNTQCVQETKFFLKIMEPPHVECGLSDAVEFHSPWLASFWKPTEVAPFCYGVLIDERWVLTTASCVIGSHRRKLPGFEVKFNVQYNDLQEIQATSVRVLTVIIHPQFSRRLATNDIGLVYLEAFLPLSDPGKEIYPICLPSPRSTCELITQGFESGFGSLNSNFLDFYHRFEKMHIVPEEECQLEAKGQLVDHVFCSKGSEDTDEDNLFAGDIGSPFEVKDSDRWTVMGIFISGYRATENGNVDLFIRIEDFLPWINSIRDL